MAIREIIGFQDFPVAGNYTTLPYLGKGMTYPFSTTGAVSSEVVNGRRRLTVTGIATPYLTYSLSGCLTLDEMKTRKIWVGFRYQVPGDTVTTSAAILRLDQYTTTDNWISTALLSGDMTLGAEVYIECCIDLANLTMSTYIDGTKIRDVAITDLRSTLTDLKLSFGRVASAATGKVHTYNDFYVLLDTADLDGGSTPSTRLGPVKIGACLVDSVALGADWGNPSAGDPATILDANTMDPSNTTTPVLRTSTTDTVTTVGFATPTNVFPIKAVSLDLYAFRDTGTTTQISSQLSDGVNTLPEQVNALPIAALPSGNAIPRLGIFHKALDGSDWTPSKLDAVTVALRSTPNS